MSVLAIVEERMAGEVLAAAQEFGTSLGTGVQAYSIDLPYTADAYTAAAEELIRKVNPTLVVFGHTYQTRDYAPKLATRFGRALIGDVIAGKPPVFVRQMFQGKFNADVRLAGDGPHFVSIQAGAWRADAASAQVEIGRAHV
jgi:electron transfer flavoprotein alpha subunit